MSRIKLKNGGKPRKKAAFGADGAIMAAATLAAAAMNVAATTKAAKDQAKAVEANAKTQSQALLDQNNNNNNLQRESINFTAQQNAENRQQQQDIQMTLQRLAGQQNLNDRMEANKLQVKYGGRPKKKSIKSQPFYGGANKPFHITDGGSAIPLQIDNNGYGLYELYGNDHEHYHKAPGGKYKSGVGVKFNDGSVVEGEGNQNSNKGELMYITPDDAIFISKHNIKGYNPREAVMNGIHPIEAFNTQQAIKATNGIKDDGSKAKCGTRKSIKKIFGGANIIFDTANQTQYPSNGTVSVAGGTAYAIKSNDKTSSPVAKCGKKISIKRCGGRVKALFGYGTNTWNKVMNTNFAGNNTQSTANTTSNNSRSFWDSGYGGAAISAGGNLLGSVISMIGNNYASRKLSSAYNNAGNIMADAYSRMTGINLDEIKREDYDAPHTLAVIRDANTNINPQLERIRRNTASETREINRETLSSAARQQRLAGTQDRMFQRMSELYAYKQNEDERIKQSNAERITQVAQANADRDIQARRNWGNQRLAVLQYNNDINNAKIAGIAQSYADAMTQSAGVQASTRQANMNSLAGAISSGASGFASTYDGIRNEQATLDNILIGADTDNVVRYLLTNPKGLNNKRRAQSLINGWKDSNNGVLNEYSRQLKTLYNV